MGYLDFIDPGNSGGSVPSPASPWDGLPPPAPVYYLCSICGARFKDTDRLFEHRFNEHPLTRPTLILDGREITSPRQIISTPLDENQITFVSADRCSFDAREVTTQSLPKLLAKTKAGVHTIHLERQGIETHYEIVFEIAESKELEVVEHNFLSIVGSDTLSVDRINLFAEMTSKCRTAIRYVDGLCQYLYGVLAKDQRGGTHLNISEYKTKFNLAIDGLSPFDRPLANVVVGIINFAQNAFGDGNALAFSPKLQRAMRTYFGYLNNAGTPSAKGAAWPGNGMGNVPIDHATDQIIQWVLEPDDEAQKHLRQMEAVIDSGEWVPDDRLKVSLLLAERLAARHDYIAAKRFARTLTHDAIFSEWAERIMEMDTAQ